MIPVMNTAMDLVYAQLLPQLLSGLAMAAMAIRIVSNAAQDKKYAVISHRHLPVIAGFAIAIRVEFKTVYEGFDAKAPPPWLLHS